MRIVIQIFVVLLAVYLIMIVVRGRTSLMGKAVKKVGFTVLALSMVVTVFFPWIIDKIALFVGVSSGLHLFVYLLAAAFVVFGLNSYLYQQDQKDSLVRLSRRVAIIEAVERYGIGKSDS